MSKSITLLYDGLLEKRREIKIVRSQWGLVVGVKASAKELKRALAAIPDDAVIIDEEDYNPGILSPVNSVEQGIVYVFEVEQTDKED